MNFVSISGEIMFNETPITYFIIVIIIATVTFTHQKKPQES